MAGKQGWNLKGPDSKDRAHQMLEQHYAWKGDQAQSQTKRDRARRRYPLGPCEQCGEPGSDRHHKDEDTGNNNPENIKILCRKCHMLTDGRLEKLIVMVKVPRQAPKPCVNCGRLYKPLRRGRCGACNMYFHRTGKEWAPEVFTTKKRIAGPIDALHHQQAL